MRRALVLGLLLAAGAAAAAPPLAPRDSALLAPRGSWSVGVLEPLRYAVSDRVTLSAHPLLCALAPNAGAEVALGRVGGVVLAGEAGASVPTLALRVLQGHLLPEWKTSGRTVGLSLVPHAGVRASRALGEPGLLTVSADVAVGLTRPLGETQGLGAPAPLELLLAPALGGVRTRAGVLGEWALRPRLRLRLQGDLFHYDAGGSPWSTRVGAGVDVGVGVHGRLALGAQWWSSDQHAYDFASGEHHRSHDFLPTLDFIWAG
ncbi:hypothetical protein FGE12_03980 [Aggregicoccus sp. 17bor-14]|uniref:hypothetical protein n=1 Tax=Myxococcaceae TaxID=31 RepID=UPI00129D0B33|nr:MULTISPECIES: hypothetical protein [Myxococcaceae]MBF5041533.1 hypothetical protein [Simulacricoccus sp. 17bor-14]MRI87318.1 hypothetical protein [Aggregicoccus sp. 17bor-14]